jgi:hypothetical protein
MQTTTTCHLALYTFHDKLPAETVQANFPGAIQGGN